MNSTGTTSPTLTLTLAVRIVVPFAMGYFLSYLFRAVNAVLAPDLVSDLALDAAILGLLTSVYFLAFGFFQLPLGVLLDRYGPRRVEFCLLLVAATGALIFSYAQSESALIVGRALIGLGVSACLMGAFKAFVMWFPKDRLPTVNGIQMMAGSAGIVASAQPVESALAYTDWRGIYFWLAIVTVFVAFTLLLIVPERRLETRSDTFTQSVRELGDIFKSPVFWSIAPISAMSQAAFLSLQTLWAGPWLRDVAGFSRADVAFALTIMAVSLIPSYAIIGWFTSWLGRFGIPAMTVAVTGTVLFLVTQGLLLFEPVALAVPVWVCFNVFATFVILMYAVLPQCFDTKLAGRVITACNAIVFTSAFVFQYVAGIIIRWWSAPGAETYAPAGYRAAIVTMVVLQTLALVSHFILRKRYRLVEKYNS